MMVSSVLIKLQAIRILNPLMIGHFSVDNYKEIYTNGMLVIDFGPMRKL